MIYFGDRCFRAWLASLEVLLHLVELLANDVSSVQLLSVVCDILEYDLCAVTIAVVLWNHRLIFFSPESDQRLFFSLSSIIHWGASSQLYSHLLCGRSLASDQDLHIIRID